MAYGILIKTGKRKGYKVLKELIKIANELDRKGLTKEADNLDMIISKTAAKKKKALYTGAFLTGAGREMLRSWWLRHVKVPLHANQYMHHMTIKFKPSEEEVLALSLDSVVKLKIVGYAADEKGQAVLVAGVDSTNDDPHVTVSTANIVVPVEEGEAAPEEPKTKKVSPAYSNELLGGGYTEVSEKESEMLDARIGFFNGKEIRYDLEGSIYEKEDDEDPILLADL